MCGPHSALGLEEAERELDDGHALALAREPPAGREARAAVVAERGGVRGVAVVRAAAHGRERGQKVCEGAHRRGLARPAVAHDEDAADGRRDDVQQKRELHLLLPDDGREGEDRARC